MKPDESLRTVTVKMTCEVGGEVYGRAVDLDLANLAESSRRVALALEGLAMVLARKSQEQSSQ